MKFPRCLPPTAAPLSLQDLLGGVLGLGSGHVMRTRLESEIKRYFCVKHVFLLSSGKAALATIVGALLSTSSRRNVVIPAYTCFSVPSAIVRAGGQVVLCDVDPHTLDFDFSQLKRVVDRDTLCIVSPHLLGKVADVNQIKNIATPFDVHVIEDVAQAMGGRTNEGWLGTGGDVGFFSLGRGKNITAGSGGIIITNSDRLAANLTQLYAAVPEASVLSRLVNAVMVCATAMLIHPRIYWLPASLPFLGLGETTFCTDFPIRRLDDVRAGFLMRWQQRLEQSNTDRTRNVAQYLGSFSREVQHLDPARVPGMPYLRLPIILPTAEQKQELCAVGKERGLGLSALYPTPISKIPALMESLDNQRYPGAEVLADRLVTLPVHHYVEQHDIVHICELLRDVVGKGGHKTVGYPGQLAERKPVDVSGHMRRI